MISHNQDINISVEQRKLLDEHLRLVLSFNKTVNLTRIESWEEGQRLHIEDSLYGLPLLQQAPEGAYADLGSGAGFPGIPLAVMSGRLTWLVDSASRKANALCNMVIALGLQQQIQVFSGRAEDLACLHPESFSVVSARAVSSLNSLMELAAPLLIMGGWLVCYKGRLDNQEKQDAVDLQGKLGLTLIQQKEFTLSDMKTQRTIFVFEKVAEPKVNLPRRPGMAQKRPYKK